MAKSAGADQIWQKTYARDTLPFRQVPNNGQKPKYYAEECCPPIISKESFDSVQKLIQQRNKQNVTGQRHSSPYRKHICCTSCGTYCRRKRCGKTWCWVCRQRDYEKDRCPVKQVSESELIAITQKIYGKLRNNRDAILGPLLMQLKDLRERELRANNRISDIDREMARLAEQNLVLNRLKDKGTSILLFTYPSRTRSTPRRWNFAACAGVSWKSLVGTRLKKVGVLFGWCKTPSK